MQAASTDRVVLQGVPKVQLYVAEAGRCPESICAPTVVRALMEYLGESIGCSRPPAAGPPNTT
jgi:hypothetical protein